MKLYELTESYQQIQQMMNDPDADMEAIKDTLDAIESAFDDKVDQLASMYKDFLSDADAMDEEAKKLKARSTAKRKSAEWIKGYIYSMMTQIGRKKVETVRNVVSIQAPRASAEVDDKFVEWAMAYHDDLLRYKEPEPDKAKILQLLKDGEILEHCQLNYKQSPIIK